MYKTCGILLLGSDSEAKSSTIYLLCLQNILTKEKVSRILFENNNPIQFTRLTRNQIPKAVSLELKPLCVSYRLQCALYRV